MSREQILVELEGRARLAKKLFILKSVETSIIPKEEAKTILKSFNDKASEEGPDRATSIFLYLMPIFLFCSLLSIILIYMCLFIISCWEWLIGGLLWSCTPEGSWRRRWVIGWDIVVPLYLLILRFTHK